jgi:hypothetical protein
MIGATDTQDIEIDAQELVTGRTCIIAQSGAGKSWGIAVLCEQLLQMNIGFCIIDTEGEYASLKDVFPAIWVGSDANCDKNIDQMTAQELTQLLHEAIYSRDAIIFDVSETDMRERVTLLADTLYQIESHVRQPFLLIVEEADKFIPQSGESIREIEEISRRGRKRGLGLMIATQRPSLVTKNVLSQCNNQIIGKLSIENDLKSVRLFFSSVKEVNELTELTPGEFFIMGGLSHGKTKMHFHARICEHRGLTPQLTDKPLRAPQTNKSKPAILPSPLLTKVAVPLTIQRDDALTIATVNRGMTIPIIKPPEHIASVDLVYRPFHRVLVRYLGGFLRTSVKTASFTLDGYTGGIIDPRRTGIRVRADLTEILGLDTDEVRTVVQLANGGSTLDEIVSLTHTSLKAATKTLQRLMKMKLVTTVATINNTQVYAPLLEFEPPTIRSLNLPWTVATEPFDKPSLANELATNLDEPTLRTVLKGLDPTAEIAEFKTLYYPTYSVRYVSDFGERTLTIDGCSGNTLVFPPVLSTAPARVVSKNI